MRHVRAIPVFVIAIMLGVPVVARADEGDEFFEKSIRPLLSERCFECHSGAVNEPKSGLRLDSREGLLQGGTRGPAIVPGSPEKSRLIEAVGYKDVKLQMPPKGKLPESAIADLTKWVQLGAPWPGVQAVSTTAKKPVFDIAKRKQEHWAWQPLRIPPVPAVRNAAWPRSPIDCFILSKLEENGLEPAPPANSTALIRRLHFDLVGLPPSEDCLDSVLCIPHSALENSDFEILVDRLLASPQFGERWGRHWLDLVRYAESRGHEYDYNLPNAYQYRDYVIRALNQDLPYDQFVSEHVAGDLLKHARINSSGFNESILATGFWFLGEELHSPVDVRQDQADRFDNRIDVFSKAFLGLTVACARCHHHKFDAILAKDYYALFGFLSGSNDRLVRFEAWEQNRQVLHELEDLREKNRVGVSRELARLLKPALGDMAAGAEQKVPATNIQNSKAESEKRRQDWQKSLKNAEIILDYSRPDAAWMPDDVDYGSGPARAGELCWKTGENYLLPRFIETAAAESNHFADRWAAPPGNEADAGALNSPNRPGRTIRTPSFRIT